MDIREKLIQATDLILAGGFARYDVRPDHSEQAAIIVDRQLDCLKAAGYEIVKVEAVLKAARAAEQWMAKARKRRDGYDAAAELTARDELPAIHQALADALGREDGDA